METWDAVRARRNVREYTDQPIARDDLERILEAGRRAPSASNWQPWNFVVVTAREQLVELAKAWPQGGIHIARSAATIAIVAEALGIGSGHSAVADQEQAQRVLGFPAGHFAAYMIGLGYPADRPLQPI